MPNRSAGRGARRWKATPEAGSAFAAEMDKGVEACRSGVEKPPECADDLRFVPRPAQGTAEEDATSGWTLSCFDLSTDRALERSSSFTGVRRGCEDGGGRNGEVAAEEGERKKLPSSSSIGTGCLCTRWEYRRCTGGGDLNGDWRKMSSCSGSCTGGEKWRCLSGDGVNMGES